MSDGEFCLGKSRSNPFLESSNEGKTSCQRKQRDPLMGLQLKTDRYLPITSQTRYPLRHAAPQILLNLTIKYVYQDLQVLLIFKSTTFEC